MGYKKLVRRCTTSTDHQLLYTEKSKRLHIFYIHVLCADTVIRMTSSAYNKSQGSMLITSIITMENRKVLDRFLLNFTSKLLMSPTPVRKTERERDGGDGEMESERVGERERERERERESERERWICA